MKSARQFGIMNIAAKWSCESLRRTDAATAHHSANLQSPNKSFPLLTSEGTRWPTIMLTIFGNHTHRADCDGASRRDFLTIGGMALGGLALPQLLARPSSQPGSRSPQGDHQRLSARRPAAHRHVGPQARRPGRDPRRVQPDQDERARASRSASCFPSSPAMADKFAIIRSLADCDGDHDALSVHDRPQAAASSRRPAAGRRWARGSAKLQGERQPGGAAERRA